MPKIKLSKNFITNVCKLALNEDLYPSGDITSNLLRNNTKIKANLLSNQAGIIGGLDFVKQTFKLIDKKIKIKIKKKEGSKIKKGSLIAIIEGLARREIPFKTKMIIQQIAIFLILGLTVFVLVNDIKNLF